MTFPRDYKPDHRFRHRHVDCYELLGRGGELWASVEIDALPPDVYSLRTIRLVAERAQVFRRGSEIELVREDGGRRTWTIPTPGANEEFVAVGASTLIFLVDYHQLWIRDHARSTRIVLAHINPPEAQGERQRLRLDPGMNLLLADGSAPGGKTYELPP